MAKEGLEDSKWFLQDMNVNRRKASVHSMDILFEDKPWMKVGVGDVLKSEKGSIFSLETMNLDGETNLKVRRALEVTLPLDEDEALKEFGATIKCEDPIASLYTSVGNLEYDHQVYPLDPTQFLLRDSKLRNTGYVYGVVAFTGHDSKVMQNSTKAPSKRSMVELQMDKTIYLLFGLLLLISCVSSIGFASNLSGLLHLLTALILYGYLIPISLYVLIEVVKVLQASFINQDITRTSNLNEELGQVDTILSDKTGTLTCNQMDFLKCSIAGTQYGTRASDVELAAAKQLADGGKGFGASGVQLETGVTSKDERNLKPAIKGFSFEDSRLMKGCWMKEPNADVLLLFFRILAICHAAIPEHYEETGGFNYESVSRWKYHFLMQPENFSKELKQVFLEYKILNLLDFTSKKKRMAVIIWGDSGQILLVPQCIDKLAQVGLKIWVLTSDKMETAINIGHACSLLSQGMKQICITTADAAQDSKQATKENILKQITDASQMVKLEKDPRAAFALIIDGKTLSYALEDDTKHQFLNLAVDCASVICCRVSPRQKALVTRLVKEGTGKITLGIDIGVGISGAEGMQAVMASDFAVAQFRFLERLLVVHGHWCYKRIAQMICYFFYRNIAFGLTFFYFEVQAGFSGLSVYDGMYVILFNVLLTSLPVIALGVFEQDVPPEVCLQFPALYQQGPRNLFFDWHRVFGWLSNGIYTSLVVFFLHFLFFYDQAFHSDSQTADLAILGTSMFTCVIWAVNCQIALTMCHLTWIQHVFIWGSIAVWYLSLVLYGEIFPDYAKYSFRILQEHLGPSLFWCTTLLLFQRAFRPRDHHIIQEIKYFKKDVQDEHMLKREFTARVDAKIRNLKGRLQKKHSQVE
ncbi:unnamed protein product [Withania somnifera]